mmetsp:Transcript_53476/g.134608  ORF Transcript_53476/g.134608 Transcript_53476/m.134608 type:complete len:259 (-) Transcript_53476:163-939(-)
MGLDTRTWMDGGMDGWMDVRILVRTPVALSSLSVASCFGSVCVLLRTCEVSRGMPTDQQHRGLLTRERWLARSLGVHYHNTRPSVSDISDVLVPYFRALRNDVPFECVVDVMTCSVCPSGSPGVTKCLPHRCTHVPMYPCSSRLSYSQPPLCAIIHPSIHLALMHSLSLSVGCLSYVKCNALLGLCWWWWCLPPPHVDRTVSTVSVSAYPLADLLSLCLCCLPFFGCKPNRSTSLHLSVDGVCLPVCGQWSARELERV